MGQLKFGDNIVTVKRLRDSLACQPKKPVIPSTLSKAPLTNSPQHILNVLNDECLEQIFSENYLNQSDLCAVAAVCQRFYNVAMQVFVVEKSAPEYLANSEELLTPLWQIDEHFRVFGNLMEWIDTKNFTHQSICLGLITKYCTRLEKLDCAIFEENTFIEMQPLIRRLHELQLKLYTKDRLVLPSIACSNLTYLHLQLFHSSNLADIQEFFIANSQLKRLALWKCHFNFDIGDLLRFLPDLRELTLRTCEFDMDLAIFGQLTLLESLDLFVEPERMRKIIEKAIDENLAIHSLTLGFVGRNDQQLVDLVGQLTYLRTLKIGGIDDTILMQMVTKCTNLTRIIVHAPAVTFGGIRKMLNIALHRLEKAAFVIHQDVDECDEVNAIGEMIRGRSIEFDVMLCRNRPNTVSLRGFRDLYDMCEEVISF